MLRNKYLAEDSFIDIIFTIAQNNQPNHNSKLKNGERKMRQRNKKWIF